MPSHFTRLSDPRTDRPAAPPVTSPTDAYHRALAIGVRFGPGYSLGYCFPSTTTKGQTAETDLLAAYLRANTAAVLAVAASNPPSFSHHQPVSGLKRATCKPQKIGCDRHGKPLPKPAVTPPVQEEPPYITPYRGGLVDVNSLSADELQAEVESILTEHRILQNKLGRLPEEYEGEPFEVWEARQRTVERIAFLQRRAQQIGERQERELDQRIESFAREQRLRKDGGPRAIVPGWRLGHPHHSA